MPPSARVLTLRAVIAVAVGGITLLALSSSAALIALTTILPRTTDAARASVESVRLAEETESELLLHARSRDALVRARLERELLERLDEAENYVTSPKEEVVLNRARSAVRSDFEATNGAGISDDALTAAHERAYAAIGELVELNVAQARAAQDIAARWDRVANVAGVVVGSSLLVSATGLLLWLRRKAFAPVLSLGRAMAQFAKGDRDARAKENGPAELKEMNRRFNEMAEMIVANQKAQLAFVGAVAHDLRGPLAAQRLALALVRREPDLRPRAVLALDKMDKQLGRLDRMVADFLDIARIEVGQLDVRLSHCDVREVVEEIIAVFEDGSGRIALRAAGDTVVAADRLRLEQVFTNLVSNAVKYSAPGTPIDVVVDGTAANVVVVVRDHGVGISAENRAAIFEPFRRITFGAGGPPGVGLGLHVVKRIVEAHDGRIDVESDVGKGSAFRVVLPRAPGRGAELVDGEAAVQRTP